MVRQIRKYCIKRTTALIHAFINYSINLFMWEYKVESLTAAKITDLFLITSANKKLIDELKVDDSRFAVSGCNDREDKLARIGAILSSE